MEDALRVNMKALAEVRRVVLAVRREGQFPMRFLPVHQPVEATDFMYAEWCGGCETCGPAPDICAACSYDQRGRPLKPVSWPCPIIRERCPNRKCRMRPALAHAGMTAELLIYHDYLGPEGMPGRGQAILGAFSRFIDQGCFNDRQRGYLKSAFWSIHAKLLKGLPSAGQPKYKATAL